MVEEKKISTEWNDVIVLENDNNILCKRFLHMISRKIERVKNHLAKCKVNAREKYINKSIKNRTTESK